MTNKTPRIIVRDNFNRVLGYTLPVGVNWAAKLTNRLGGDEIGVYPTADSAVSAIVDLAARTTQSH